MKTQIVLIVVMTLWINFSCREVDQFVPVEDNVPFEFSQEFTGPQDTLTYELTISEPIIIRTPKGTEFVFKPEMFVFTNGDYCECDQVRIEIIELDKKRDYLVHEASTISDGELLVSAGAYHVAAYAKGKPLKLAPGHLACFWLPSPTLDPEMKLFYGERTISGFNWTPSDLRSGFASITPGQWQYNDTTDVIVGYQCFSERLDWINVDKFVQAGSRNPVCIKLDEAFTSENTVVFAVLKDEKSILKTKYSANDGFCLTNIPVGSEVLFIGIRKSGANQYEMASEFTTIEKNHFQSLNFNQTDFNEIRNYLANL